MQAQGSITIIKQLDTPVNATAAQVATAVAGETVMTLDGSGITFGSTYGSGNATRMVPDLEYLNFDLKAASVDNYIFTAVVGRWRVVSAATMVAVVGGSGANVDVKVCTSSQAPASGTTQLSAVFDLTVTAPSFLQGTIIASPTVIGPGMSLALDFSGTLTGLVGNITVALERLR